MEGIITRARALALHSLLISVVGSAIFVFSEVLLITMCVCVMFVRNLVSELAKKEWKA